ncbi:hypothetical protein TNCV_5071121 [Trichonephila clavipes]|nr:hypothetical protein TNCV_5071121 [Trichonephila clavipes]
MVFYSITETQVESEPDEIDSVIEEVVNLACEDTRHMDRRIRSLDLIRKEHTWDALWKAIITRNSARRTIKAQETELLNE